MCNLLLLGKLHTFIYFIKPWTNAWFMIKLAPDNCIPIHTKMVTIVK